MKSGYLALVLCIVACNEHSVGKVQQAIQGDAGSTLALEPASDAGAPDIDLGEEGATVWKQYDTSPALALPANLEELKALEAVDLMLNRIRRSFTRWRVSAVAEVKILAREPTPVVSDVGWVVMTKYTASVSATWKGIEKQTLEFFVLGGALPDDSPAGPWPKESEALHAPNFSVEPPRFLRRLI